MVVEKLVTPPLGDDLREDHCQCQVWVLPVQRLQVVDEWSHDSQVGGGDDAQREVVAPKGPVVPETAGLFLGEADMHGEDGLLERGRVGERAHRC